MQDLLPPVWHPHSKCQQAQLIKCARDCGQVHKTPRILRTPDLSQPQTAFPAYDPAGGPPDFLAARLHNVSAVGGEACENASAGSSWDCCGCVERVARRRRELHLCCGGMHVHTNQTSNG